MNIPLQPEPLPPNNNLLSERDLSVYNITGFTSGKQLCAAFMAVTVATVLFKSFKKVFGLN